MYGTYFSHIRLTGWKQFHNITINFHPNLTVLTGANGSGKTTLLNLLARHFGWNFIELATPIKDKNTGVVTFKPFIDINRLSFYNNQYDTNNTYSNIGEIGYSNNACCQLMVHNYNQNHSTYSVEMTNQQYFRGLNISSHRPQYKYQQINHIPTQKRNKSTANEILTQSIIGRTLNNSYGPTNDFFIKETLLSWAIIGGGNSYMEADSEIQGYFESFQDVLRIILPATIGFIKFSIRNYEIILITKSGEFILDSVSGGLSALIDLSWQIFNFSVNSDEKAVVLIDEIENHLHASLQRNLLPNLISAFPNVQFIVSTHSPLVVGSVKESHVYAFRYNDQNRVFSEQLDLINKAKSATEILDEVLGVPFTMPIWVENQINSIVDKYSNAEHNEQTFSEMRTELKSIGLEDLMPTAMISVIDNQSSKLE